MSEELYHTSAPRGLHPGTGGFCTVAMTSGISPLLEERLTLLSAYRWADTVSDDAGGAAGASPVAWAHWRLPLGGRTFSVLSRVADAGVDHSRRSNRFAHHLVLEASEQVDAGPAWLLRRQGVMQTVWAGPPRLLPSNRSLPNGPNPTRACDAWAGAAGDAAWGRVLAEAYEADPQRVAWVIAPAGVDLLALFDESIALISPVRRWEVTFNTYFIELPAGLSCAWRGCPAGSRIAAELISHPGTALVIDLTRPMPSLSPADVSRLTRPAVQARPVAAESLVPLARTISPRREAEVVPLRDVEHASTAPEVTTIHEWMPPESATVIEYAAPRRRAKKVSGVTWLILAACLLVAVSTVAWFLTSEASYVGSAVTPATPAGPLPNPAIVGAVKTETSHSQTPAIPTSIPVEDTHRAALLSQVADLTREKQKLEEELAAISRQAATAAAGHVAEVERLTAELSEVRSAQAMDATRSVTTTAPAAATGTPPAPNVLDDRYVLWQSPASSSTAADRIELSAPPVPAALTLAQPEPTRLVIRPAGRALTVDSSGSIVSTDLAAIQLKSGRLTFEWRDKKRFREIDGAAGWLGLSVVRVFRQKEELAAAQPVAPLLIKLNLSDVVAVLPDLRGAPPGSLALVPPVDPPTGWSARTTNGDPLTASMSSLREPAAHFEISLGASGPVGTVRATWRDHRASLANVPSALKEIDGAPPFEFLVRYNPTGAVVARVAIVMDRPHVP